MEGMADAPSRSGRPYDVILLGATGFTGGLTADRLAADGPDDLRWAIAGRAMRHVPPGSGTSRRKRS